jgi:hypothetical protein
VAEFDVPRRIIRNFALNLWSKFGIHQHEKVRTWKEVGIFSGFKTLDLQETKFCPTDKKISYRQRFLNRVR